MKRWLSIALTLCLLLAAQSRASAADCAVQHTVKAGENLFRIGLKYGVSWRIIAQANNLANPNLISIGQVLCIPNAAATPTPSATATPSGTSTPAPATATPVPYTGKVPMIRIAGVVRDQTVTLQAWDFPPGQTFDVLMGAMGTRGVNGTKAATQDSGSGSFTATYSIPAVLRGSSQISIRLQSAFGYYSFNWFYNNTTP